jgi:hypothetical protein
MHLGPNFSENPPHTPSLRSSAARHSLISATQRSGDSAWQPRAHYSTAKWIIRLTIVTFGEPEHIPRFPRISVVAMESKAAEPVRWYHWELYSRCYHCMRRVWSESEWVHPRENRARNYLHEIPRLRLFSLGSLVCISLVNSMPGARGGSSVFTFIKCVVRASISAH